ncbi:ANTAR domain-containing response regulator [Streptomyces sp. NBC_01766]|uniref:ANTAR domain-containing response regulator n=1 Tax=Streptomyces sp. NBC_01766 TaxID=2975936 RepID=UPI002DD9E3E4|nr:ANTAR domain-containing protein [Streptomyces sp. NBC_01766]WSC19718.1 ANTAR domain-containing protein [Streptomyces sp. NBC_01766]
MEQEQQWMRSAFGLAAVAADEARAPQLMRHLCNYCVELLHLSGAAVIRAGAAGSQEGGPGSECLRDDRALTNLDLREEARRWPEFTARARAGGHTAVTLLPLRGTAARPCAVLQLLSKERQLSETEVESAQWLGDLAVALLRQGDELRRQRETAEQLSRALDSRIVIEQAKGVLAEQLRLDMDGAFAVLRGHARSNRLKLTDVARAVVERQLVLDVTESG